MSGKLVLSRKLMEEIYLDCGGKFVITITVVKIRGSQVALAFEAPQEVVISRAELSKKS